jgi:outer membrane receptor protein involved in Fe transport
MLLWSAAVVAAPHQHFDLPAAPLSDGIARIGLLSGINVATSDPALLSQRGGAVHIDGTAHDALTALLRGTSARAVQIGSAGWRIVARHKAAAQRAVDPVGAGPAGSEIVVTGSKLETPLARYPASVSVVRGSELMRFGVTPDTAALARLDPTLQSTHLGPGRDKLFLRGIADSSFNGSGAALVGQYFDDMRLTYNAPDPDLRLYDVSRVEILEGAQGTLYGAGSMAGLIRVTPQAPVFGRASADAWIGGTAVAHGAAGGDIGGVFNEPLAGDRAALRVVGYGARDGGYIDDAARGRDDVNRTGTLGGRATFSVRIGEQWRIDLGGILQDIRNRDAQYAERDLPPLTRASLAAQPSANLFRSGDIVLAGPIAGLYVTSTTGTVHQHLGQSFLPQDGNVEDIYRQRDQIALLSEEFRIASHPGRHIEWVGGFSALISKAEQIRTITLDGFDRSLGRAHNDITDITAFGELTAHLTSTLALMLGGRLAAVRLAGIATGALEKIGDTDKIPEGDNPHFRGTRHERFAVPSVALGWSPSREWLIYGRFSEGYRPGGQTASGIIQRYDADRIYSLEAGVRLTPLGTSRLSGQISAATNRWHDVQADTLDANGLPVTQNIGNGTVRSLTGSLDWKPVPALALKLAATLARGQVIGRDPVLDVAIRTPLPNVARDTVAASLDYSHAIDDGHDLTVGVSINHVGRSVLGSGSTLSHIEQGGYWLVSSGADLRLGVSAISIDIVNLLDSSADSFAFGTPTFQYDNAQLTPLRPRTVRIGFRHRF